MFITAGKSLNDTAGPHRFIDDGLSNDSAAFQHQDSTLYDQKYDTQLQNLMTQTMNIDIQGNHQKKCAQDKTPDRIRSAFVGLQFLVVPGISEINGNSLECFFQWNYSYCHWCFSNSYYSSLLRLLSHKTA